MQLYKICGSHTSGYDDFYLLGYNAVDMFLRNVGCFPMDYMGLHSKRYKSLLYKFLGYHSSESLDYGVPGHEPTQFCWRNRMVSYTGNFLD
jgi:hypothetical protein